MKVLQAGRLCGLAAEADGELIHFVAVGNRHSSGTVGGGEALSSHWESILVAEAVTMCRRNEKGPGRK